MPLRIISVPAKTVLAAQGVGIVQGPDIRESPATAGSVARGRWRPIALGGFVVIVGAAAGYLAGPYLSSESSDKQATVTVVEGDGTRGPKGMVWVPAGEFLMGSEHELARPNERPAHRVRVAGFWMDRTHVTNAQFAEFVKATGYVTTAERKPDWET